MPDRRAPRGRGSVFEDKARGRWIAQKRVAGVTHRRVRRTKAEAFLALDELNGGARRGASLATQPTVNEFLTGWLETLEVRPTTLRGYRTYVEQYLVPELGGIRLDRLTPQHVDQALVALKRRLAPRSVSHVRAILRNALRRAEQYGMVQRNVAQVVDAVKVPNVERAVLTPAQARRLRESYRGDRLEALFVIAMTLGLRRSELAGLRWQDVELVNGHINIRQSVHRVNQGFVTEEPKTPRSRRTVPLTEEILELLRRRRAEQLEEYLATAARPDHDLVFTSPAGKPAGMDQVARQHRRRLEDLGLPHSSFHDLRHVAASNLAGVGFTLKEVQAILGHSSVAITANVYTHVDDDSVAERMRGLRWS